MKTSEFLTQARDLIWNGWTKTYFARDKFGISVEYTSDKATCFCSEGALKRVSYKNGDSRTYYDALYLLMDVIKTRDIAEWNDSQFDKFPVIRAFNDAIVKAEQKEAQA